MSSDVTAFARIATELAKTREESDVPRYRQIVDLVLATIDRGLLKPGDRLPPETELADLFDVSLGTLQRALTQLAGNGILQRARRRGTVVLGRRADDVFVFRFKEPGTGRVLVPFTRVLSVEVDRSDGPWRQYLGGRSCVRVDRLVWVEGEAPAFSQFRVSVEHGRSLLGRPVESLHGYSFHRALGRQFNLPTVHTSHRLRCAKLSALARRHLGLPTGVYGTLWDVVGYSHRRATSYQSLQLQAGHRPIELEVATAGVSLGLGPERSVDGDGAWH